MNADARGKRSGRWFRVYCGGLLILFAGLIGRLVYLQLMNGANYMDARNDQTQVVRKRPAPRGNLYDRNGRLLATSSLKGSVYADPGLVRDPASTAETLHRILGVRKAPLLEKLRRENDRFVWVKRHVSPGLVKKVRSRSLRGVRVREEYTRTYPHGSVASHVMGFVGTERTGLAGLEKTLNETLTGQPGQLFYLRDGTGKLMFRPETGGRDPVPGPPITLTLDLGVQQAARRELKRTMKEHDANWSCLIAMNPDNGAVLAMANRPSFNLNSFQTAPAPARRNRSVTDPVEPGSSFKPIVMAAALEEGRITPDTTFFCENGAWSYRGRLLHDYKSFGTLTVAEILEQSSNIGMAKIGLKLGEDLRPWVRRFAFGEPTGISLPGEEPGFVQTKENWNSIYTQTSVPMGHEILTTPLQMVRSYCTFANGGFAVRPKLVRRRGKETVVKPDMTGRKIIRRDTARTMMELMRSVVTDGTGTPVQSDRIAIAGKTGTSKKYSNKEQYLSVFIGVAPVSDPQIVVGAFVDEPQGEYSGGRVAGPPVRRVIERAKQYLNIRTTATGNGRRKDVR